MSTSREDFDPLARVVDWLDACRTGELKTLLDLYDEKATLECACEAASFTGRAALAAYWGPKLETRVPTAFDLDDMSLGPDGVWLDYRSYEGNPVRIHFRFGVSGKILHSSCDPLALRCAC